MNRFRILGAVGLMAVAAITGACIVLEDESKADAGAAEDAGADAEESPVCQDSFEDCDRFPWNGCEIDLATDPDNCGGCRLNCNGAPCLDGICGALPSIVAGNQINPTNVVADGSHVYWLVSSVASEAGLSEQGALVKGSLDALDVESTILAKGAPVGLTISPSSAYWTNPLAGTVESIDKSSSAINTLAIDQESPQAIGVDANYLFWVGRSANQILRYSLGGADIDTIVQHDGFIGPIHTNGSRLYYATADSIRSVDRDGKDPTEHAKDLRTPTWITSDAKHIYFSVLGGETPWSNDGRIGRVDIANDELTWIADKEAGPMRLAVDGDNVYWTTYFGGRIRRRSIVESGAITTIASQQAEAWGIALDEQNVYWTALGTGAVMRMPKKPALADAGEQ